MDGNYPGSVHHANDLAIERSGDPVITARCIRTRNFCSLRLGIQGSGSNRPITRSLDRGTKLTY
jgi:hypothetical protein